ncbi:MAG TPA: NAD(P)H-hydrate epimerase, partial [Acidobacteriota bacterium]|nr:NAD(P)H-hydrate epimerase [Acidobacteriota bacterium]
MKVLTADQMREVDRLSTEVFGIPSLTLMENAGFNLYLAVQESFEEPEGLEIAIICGKGNNGGDGLVLARQLITRGYSPDVFLLAARTEISGDAAVNLKILEKSNYPVFEITSGDEWYAAAAHLGLYDVIVDAILGTGITKPLRGFYSQVVSDINETEAFVLAVDIPSGMFSDTVERPPLSVCADMTVTFTAPKLAQVLGEGIESVGDLIITPIGSPAELMDKPEYFLNLLGLESVSSQCQKRVENSHKGTYGHVSVISGSRGKSGAASLSSFAALRTGSGLVTAFVPETVQEQVASGHPEVMTAGYSATDLGTFSALAAEAILADLSGKDAAALGPGLTTHPETIEFVRRLVRQSKVPLVIDADGLNAFWQETAQLVNEHGSPLILTPHPGEFSRLTDKPVSEILRLPVETARAFAIDHAIWLVLKNFRTL